MGRALRAATGPGNSGRTEDAQRQCQERREMSPWDQKVHEVRSNRMKLDILHRYRIGRRNARTKAAKADVAVRSGKDEKWR